MMFELPESPKSEPEILEPGFNAKDADCFLEPGLLP